MPYKNLNEIAMKVYQELKNADEKYVTIENKKERIVEIEIMNMKETRPASPRIRIVTEKGTVLFLTPSKFLTKRYIIIKDGKEKMIIGQ